MAVLLSQCREYVSEGPFSDGSKSSRGYVLQSETGDPMDVWSIRMFGRGGSGNRKHNQ